MLVLVLCVSVYFSVIIKLFKNDKKYCYALVFASGYVNNFWIYVSVGVVSFLRAAKSKDGWTDPNLYEYVVQEVKSNSANIYVIKAEAIWYVYMNCIDVDFRC